MDEYGQVIGFFAMISPNSLTLKTVDDRSQLRKTPFPWTSSKPNEFANRIICIRHVLMIVHTGITFQYIMGFNECSEK